MAQRRQIFDETCLSTYDLVFKSLTWC